MRKDREPIFNKIIKFSNSITYFRNLTMQLCNLFIPPTTLSHSIRKRRFILKSVLKWKKCHFSILTHFYFLDTHSLNTECSVAVFKTAVIVSQNSNCCSQKQGTDRLFPLVNMVAGLCHFVFSSRKKTPRKKTK